MSRKIILLLAILSSSAFGYKMEGGQYFIASGIGANVNVVRFLGNDNKTPKVEMPMYATLDYSIDQNISVFVTIAPQFGGSSIGIKFQGGARYWMSRLVAPYVPFVGLALTPAFLFPTDKKKTHFNIGITPSLGINYFVMADFLVGMHADFNPSYAFIDGQRKFEFAVGGFLDVTFRL